VTLKTTEMDVMTNIAINADVKIEYRCSVQNNCDSTLHVSSLITSEGVSKATPLSGPGSSPTLVAKATEYWIYQGETETKSLNVLTGAGSYGAAANFRSSFRRLFLSSVDIVMALKTEETNVSGLYETAGL
jgi:hypothetical protein